MASATPETPIRSSSQLFTDIFVAGHEWAIESQLRIRPAKLPGQIDDILSGMKEMRLGRAHAAAMGADQRLPLAGDGIVECAGLDFTVLDVSSFHRGRAFSLGMAVLSSSRLFQPSLGGKPPTSG